MDSGASSCCAMGTASATVTLRGMSANARPGTGRGGAGGAAGRAANDEGGGGGAKRRMAGDPLA
jgi:hypothetical protein